MDVPLSTLGVWLILFGCVLGCRSFVEVEQVGRDTRVQPSETVRITSWNDEVMEGRLVALDATTLELPSGRVMFVDVREIEVLRRTIFGRWFIGVRNMVLAMDASVPLIPFD